MKSLLIAGILSAVLLGAGRPTLGANPPPAANELSIECADETDSCAAYLLGVFDGLVVGGRITKENPICPKGGVNGRQLLLIFNKWARENPEKLSIVRGVAVTAAFMDAFPCGPATP